MLTDIIITDLAPRPARPAGDERAALRDFMVSDALRRQRAQQRPTGGDAA